MHRSQNLQEKEEVKWERQRVKHAEKKKKREKRECVKNKTLHS